MSAEPEIEAVDFVVLYVVKVTPRADYFLAADLAFGNDDLRTSCCLKPSC